MASAIAFAQILLRRTSDTPKTIGDILPGGHRKELERYKW